MYQLDKEIAELENWLREHPDAQLDVRHDMIKKLGDLKTQKDELQRRNRENQIYNT